MIEVMIWNRTAPYYAKYSSETNILRRKSLVSTDTVCNNFVR